MAAVNCQKKIGWEKGGKTVQSQVLRAPSQLTAFPRRIHEDILYHHWMIIYIKLIKMSL